MAFPGDPLPSIPSALLNSADIQAYQQACGLIRGEPFQATDERLKAASYQILCRGDVFWNDPDGDGSRQQARIDKHKSFTLRRNSIAYVSPEVVFCLPDFIAARFNLTIGLVHKGLLLGTGPLIDPGFEGRLLIPLHNLTTRDVVLRETDGLIWVEFTKVSPDYVQSFSGTSFSFNPSFKPVDKNRPIELYFKKTNGVAPQSSLADNVTRWNEALKRAEDVRVKAEDTAKRLEKVSAAAISATAIAVIALIVTCVSLVRDANQWMSDQTKATIQDLRGEVTSLRDKLDALEKPSTLSAPKAEKASNEKKK